MVYKIELHHPVTSHPPDVTHVISAPMGPFQVYHAALLLCTIGNTKSTYACVANILAISTCQLLLCTPLSLTIDRIQN